MFMDSVAGSGPCRARFVEGVLQVLDDQGKWVNIRAGTRQDMGRSVSRHYPQADIGHAGAGSVLGDARGVSVSCVSFRNRTGQASPPLPIGWSVCLCCLPISSRPVRDATAVGPHPPEYQDPDHEPPGGVPGGRTEQGERGERGVVRPQIRMDRSGRGGWCPSPKQQALPFLRPTVCH